MKTPLFLSVLTLASIINGVNCQGCCTGEVAIFAGFAGFTIFVAIVFFATMPTGPEGTNLPRILIPIAITIVLLAILVLMILRRKRLGTTPRNLPSTMVPTPQIVIGPSVPHFERTCNYPVGVPRVNPNAPPAEGLREDGLPSYDECVKQNR